MRSQPLVSSTPATLDSIVVRGARTHNLKNIDVDIPHNALTVITGVSGSGKSSLAFDTIYAEGQRRYVESLSAYARQFLERIEKPDVDHMDGLAPAIAIKQKNTTRNPRSTVATVTEIYDYLRLLFARCGTMYCIACGSVVKRDSVDEVASAVMGLEDGTRLNVLFPVKPPATPSTETTPKPRKKTTKSTAKTSETTQKAAKNALSDAWKAHLFELRKRGYNRLYQNGQIVEFSTPESLLDLDFNTPLFVLVDRIVISPDIRTRLVDAIETGYRETEEVIFETVPREPDTTPMHLRFSAGYECSNCHRAYREPEPRMFSFNNPFGACPRCEGFGNTIDFDLDLILPDKTRTLDDGAVEPWTRPKYRAHFAELRRAAKQHGIPLDVPFEDLSEDQKQFVLDGHGDFPGVRGFFAALERKKYKLHVRVFLSKYRGYAVCPECKGQRLRAEARAVRLGKHNICDVTALTVGAANDWVKQLELSPAQQEISGKILEEVQQRLHFLNEVGLDYLTLDRLSSTLSGGEAQRIQLATSLGSRLVGALYVLDEPSIGLHPRDSAKLVRILEELRDLGNTIIVVEHDPDVMRAADHLLDLGPGAGELGGRILAQGSMQDLEENPASLTGRYLSGQLQVSTPQHRREHGREKLVLRGARIHNLRNVDVEIPLNMLTCVTGVSGSGKSTLVHQVLYRALNHALGQTEGADPTGLYRELHGAQHLNNVVLVDQSPIGRTPRSNPVTYIKAFDAIRELFASQPESRRRGYGAGHFSFNVPGGRCDVCEGDGTVTVEMQFLADVELPCEECGGTRYKASTLEVKYKGKNIYDVLTMTVKEAMHFFAGQPKIVDRLRVLDEVGLSYVRLGQSATTLSGGEAQRVKLAAHLANGRPTITVSGRVAQRKVASRILYILDEPTTGLHFDDIGKLLTAFRKLIDDGGSLLVIEHNLDVLKAADWIIDMGPEGGTAGGRIVATGTPEEIAAAPGSHTGEWLARVLKPKPRKELAGVR